MAALSWERAWPRRMEGAGGQAQEGCRPRRRQEEWHGCEPGHTPGWSMASSSCWIGRGHCPALGWVPGAKQEAGLGTSMQHRPPGPLSVAWGMGGGPGMSECQGFAVCWL